jgi:hypothetical protein
MNSGFHMLIILKAPIGNYQEIARKIMEKIPGKYPKC